MGFWHTGYMEFHEYSGLEDHPYEPSPPEYRCAQCSEVFATVDALRKHRFEDHPLYQPTLMLKGRELGSHPVRITAPVNESDLLVEKCDYALLNGEQVSVPSLPRVIANLPHGVSQLRLIGGEVSVEFTLDLRIASESDLIGIEREFEKTAAGRRLDTRAIDSFISATSEFRSAIGYCDGICAYLYGVLAKEGSRDSSLPNEAYVGKFTNAAEGLGAYDRPLARTIGSLIEFHFNHFSDATRLAGRARLGQAASRYDAWIRGAPIATPISRPTKHVTRSLEGTLSDWDTEQIVRWTVQDLGTLAQYTSDMETFVARDISDFDRLKVHLLLAEVYAFAGDTVPSLRHAKSLRNIPAVEQWAERLIRALAGDEDGRKR